jgi:hypothetical protein
MPTLLALTFFSGCAGTGDPMKSLQDAVIKFDDAVKNAGTSDTTQGINSSGRIFFKTGLIDIYKGKDLSSKWPRVAFTILSVSPNAYQEVQIWNRNAQWNDSCIDMTAVVWENPKKSRNIPRFQFCMGADASQINSVHPRAVQVALDMSKWATYDHSIQCLTRQHCTTEDRRTNGPTPPSTNFPKGGAFSSFALHGATYFSITFDALFQAMGLDIKTYDSMQDDRFWVKEFSAEVVQTLMKQP